MGMDPATIAGIAQAGVSAYNNLSQGKMNRKQRRWNEKMYGWQRSAALEDWDRMNQYNSPTEQMKRLKQAGLNPNLVYGDSSMMASSAPIRNADVESWSPHAPQINPDTIGESVSRYYDTRVRSVQYDNLQKQGENLDAQRDLIRAQTYATLKSGDKTVQDTRTSIFDLGLKSDLRQNSMDAQSAMLEKIQSESQFNRDNNERQNYYLEMALKKNQWDIRKTAQDIITQQLQNTKIPAERNQILQHTENMRKEGILKDWEISLSKKNLKPGDSAWTKAAVNFLKEYVYDQFPKLPTFKMIGENIRSWSPKKWMPEYKK